MLRRTSRLQKCAHLQLLSLKEIQVDGSNLVKANAVAQTSEMQSQLLLR